MTKPRKDVDRGRSRRAVRTLERTFIPHSQQRDVFDRIDELRDRCRTHDDQADENADPLASKLLLIAGESGAGKSRLLKEYLAQEKRRVGAFRTTDDGDIRPVIYVPNAAKGTREFAVLILKALGYPAPPKDWTGTDVSRHIAHLCREMCVEVLLVDEAQFIVMGKGADGIQTMRDFIKRMLNEGPAQIVLAGVPDLLKFLELDEESSSDHKQIFRRRAPVIELTPYDWSVPMEQARFIRLLERMQAMTGLEFIQPLSGEFLARRMYLASEGEIGMVAKYLSALIARPSRTADSAVGPEDLAAIWWSFHKPLGRRDRPVSFDVVRLSDERASQPSNPFFASDDELRVLWQRWALEGHSAVAAAQDDHVALDASASEPRSRNARIGVATGRGASRSRSVNGGAGRKLDPFGKQGPFDT